MNRSDGNSTNSGKRIQIGELLMEAGLIDNQVLSEALKIQKTKKKKIGQILIDMGVADDEEIAKVLASQLKIPLFRLIDMDIPHDIISMVPSELAENYLLVPIEKDEKTLLVAMANPLEIYAVDDLRFVTYVNKDGSPDGFSIDLAKAVIRGLTIPFSCPF